MKPKLILLAAAFSCGIALLNAQDAPKPPQARGGKDRPGGPGGGGDPKARIDEMFKKMDTNSDGNVSKDEFLEFSKKEAEARFNKLDASGSGSVTKEQLTDAMRRMHGGEGGQRRPEGFKKPEGTGGGTRQRPGGENNTPEGNPPPPPAEGGQRGPGKLGGGGIGEIFRKLQENGSVTKEEFSKISEEQYKRMDTNGDGKITKEEMEEQRKKMRDLRGGQDGPTPQPGGSKPKRPDVN